MKESSSSALIFQSEYHLCVSTESSQEEVEDFICFAARGWGGGGGLQDLQANFLIMKYVVFFFCDLDCRGPAGFPSLHAT